MRVNGILSLVTLSVVCSADWRSISRSKKLRIRNGFLACDELLKQSSGELTLFCLATSLFNF